MNLTLQNISAAEYATLQQKVTDLVSAHASALLKVSKRCTVPPLSRAAIDRQVKAFEREGLTTGEALRQVMADYDQAVRESTPEQVTRDGVAAEILKEALGIPVENKGAKNRYIAKIILNAWKVKSAKRTDKAGITAYIES